MTLSSLPVELIIRILLHLPPACTCTCQQLCRSLHAATTSSVTLQYRLALYKHCMLDNPLCTLPMSTKLSMLEQRELAWRYFEQISHRTIDTSDLSSHLPGLTRGFYLDMHIDQNLGLQRLSISGEDNLDNKPSKWINIDEETQGRIINYGMAVDEHNLIILVHAIPAGAGSTFELLLRDFTTGESHPLAQNPVIRLSTPADIAWWHPSFVVVKVAGENLVLAYRTHVLSKLYNVYIWNWFTGALKAEAPIPANNVSFVFLREDLILFPNCMKNTFDIYHIPYSSTTPIPSMVPFLCLSLPAFPSIRSISSTFCRADPIATAQDLKSPRFVSSSRPFTGDPTHALVLFIFRLHQRVSFLMVARRSDLLSIALPALKLSRLRTSNFNGITFYSIPWSLWGPSSSRWFNATEWMPIFWTTASGQRFAVLSSDEFSNPGQIKVFDFNPHHIRELKAKPLATQSVEHASVRLVDADADDNGSCKTGKSFVDDAIVSKLPYIESTPKGLYNYNALLTEEEHLIGLRTGPRPNVVNSIDLIRFG